jgi:hypothetical protein
MEDTATIRVLDVGSHTMVLSLSGQVDESWVPRIASELGLGDDRSVVVDLLAATYVDGNVLSLLIDSADRMPLTVVADSSVLHVLELTRPSPALGLNTSLSAAVAAR